VKEIVEKIKKCLALSKSDNENEAAAALEKALQLMERYGISEREVELSSVCTASQNVSTTKNPAAHLCFLATLVGKVFGVEYVFRPAYTLRGYNNTVEFVGIGAAPEIAAYAYGVLRRQLVRGRRDYLATLKRLKRSSKTRRADLWAQAWCGAVERKVRSLALPSMQQKLIETWMEEHYEIEKFRPKAAKNRGRGDNRAIMEGFLAGSDVDIHPGVGSPEGIRMVS
jgi:hypothetical protein